MAKHGEVDRVIGVWWAVAALWAWAAVMLALGIGVLVAVTKLVFWAMGWG